MNENPYQTPSSDPQAPNPPHQSSSKTGNSSGMGAVAKIGAGVLILGLMVLAYGAVGFWLINNLPPNGGAQGRLPSLYVMGIGIVLSTIGLSIRGFRLSQNDNEASRGASKGVPSSVGILILIAILVVAGFVISQM